MAGSAITWTDGLVALAAYMNALPRGVMGYALGSTADQTGIAAAATDVTSLSVTFTAISSRLYRTTGIIYVQQLTSNSLMSIIVADGAGTVLQSFSVSLATNDAGIIPVVLLETGISGSVTRKIRALTTAGTLTVKGAANVRGSINIEDQGPA